MKMSNGLFGRGRTLAAAIAVSTLGLLAGSATSASAITGAIASSVSSTVAVSPAYTVEDLGVFSDGGGATLATGINAAGDVTGYGDHATPGYTAFRWSQGTLTDLASLGCGSQGNAINDSSVVVGFSNVTCAESDKAGFASNGNSIADIGSLFARPTVAFGINGAGQIVGTSVTEHGTQRAFLSGPGGVGLQQVDSLATSEPPGEQTLAARGVNASGEVVGISFFFDQTCGGFDAPFLFDGSTIEELGECSSGQANAINDAGVAVGFLSTSNGTHAFSYDGTVHDLGVPTGTSESEALAINASGTIVGSALASQLSSPQAWVSGPTGGIRLLDTLIDPSLGWNLRVAAGINDSGQIAGYGAHNGAIHAFRLTPAAPATLTTIAVAPATPTVAVGATQQFTATGTYSDGSSADITSSVTWSTAKSKVATIDSSGLLTAVARGATNVTASFRSSSASTTVNVAPAVTLKHLAVTPVKAKVPGGSVQQFTATGTYSDGSTAEVTSAVAWSTANPAVATIDASGQLTGVDQGRTTVTAALGPIAASTTVTIGPKTLVSVLIAPSNADAAAGSTVKFTATGTFADGTTADLTSAGTWASSNTAAGTIGTHTGLARARKNGTTTITFAQGSISATATLTVGAIVGTE
jgi:probable HAF family extracellular repeat protein